MDLSSAQEVLITKKPRGASMRNPPLTNSVFCGRKKII